ncbi:hypothetical protein OKW29_004245 [Paraburkholderia sp. CI3]
MYKHEHCEDNEVQACQCFGQALVISRQSPKSVEPTETTLDDPSSRQQHEALLCRWQLDDLQFDGFVMRSLSSRVTGIALAANASYTVWPVAC